MPNTKAPDLSVLEKIFKIQLCLFISCHNIQSFALNQNQFGTAPSKEDPYKVWSNWPEGLEENVV